MIKYLILITALYILSSARLHSQVIAKGVVYEDRNKNNKQDSNEKGIVNVAVSNGTDVVLTNVNGQYQLPVANDNIIFVIKPSDYAHPVNEYQQPQSFYNHKPNGSPQLKYAGTSATGNLPKNINFGLIPTAQSDNFKILVFGDPQPYTEKEVDYFYRGIVKEVENIKGVEFGISLGDLVGDNLNLFVPYKNAIKHAGIPWYNVMGNHDENYDVQSDSLSDETFEKEFGPATYSFNHGMVHFIILDDILYPDPRDKKGYWGGFRADQLKFIENDLKFVPKDHLIVLAFHIPISENEGDDPFCDKDRTRLFELLKDYPHTLSLSAHTHFQSQDFFSQNEGWLQQKHHHHFNVGASCGDWYSGKLNENGVPISTMRDGTPKGYVYLNFNKNQYSANYKVAGKPSDYQFEIYAPKIVAQNVKTTAGIFANFFLGSEKDSVSYRIDNGTWHKMNLIKEYDPSFLHLLHEWDFTQELFQGQRPSNPVQCNHLWRGAIPADLEPGEHIIEVKAVDMFGHIHTQKSSYKIGVLQ